MWLLGFVEIVDLLMKVDKDDDAESVEKITKHITVFDRFYIVCSHSQQIKLLYHFSGYQQTKYFQTSFTFVR